MIEEDEGTEEENIVKEDEGLAEIRQVLCIGEDLKY
jgi:hypothetical protein